MATIVPKHGKIENFCFFAEMAPLKNAYKLTVLFTDKGKDFADARVRIALQIARSLHSGS